MEYSYQTTLLLYKTTTEHIKDLTEATLHKSTTCRRRPPKYANTKINKSSPPHIIMQTNYG